MGLTIEAEIPSDLGALLQARIQRGLLRGGEVALAAVVALAPTEPQAKHGVHMVETGFARMDGEARVAIGMDAYWSLWQETRDYHHPHGGTSHFLELGVSAAAMEAFEMVVRAIAEGL